MILNRSLFVGALLATAMASPRIEELGKRQTITATSAGLSAETGAANGPLIETTIDGKVTTVPVAVPSATGTTDATKATATTTKGGSAETDTTTTTNAVPTSTAGACLNSIDQPICEPRENQTLYVGNTYYISWAPAAFQNNSTLDIGLQSALNNSVVTFKPGLPSNRGFTTVTIDDAWLSGYSSLNVTLVWNYYSGDIKGQKHTAFNLTLAQVPATHLPPPAPTKLPDKESLIIALPIVFGFIVFVIIGLCIGMKKHRHIDLKSLLRRRKGYSSGKSKRQRLGIKKGAIRLEEREVLQSREPRDISYEQADYQDDMDAITPAHQHYTGNDAANGGHGYGGFEQPPRIGLQHVARSSEFSLGSLADDDGSVHHGEPSGNAFRAEMQRQQTGRNAF